MVNQKINPLVLDIDRVVAEKGVFNLHTQVVFAFDFGELLHLRKGLMQKERVLL